MNDMKNMPWIDSNEKTVRAAIIDILDQDLWSSKISFIGHLIIISAVLGGTADLLINNWNQGFWFYYSGIIFSVEWVLRISFAGSIYQSGSRSYPQLRYIFSFEGAIDIFSALPFILYLLGLGHNSWIEVFVIFRLWRIIRYFPSFRNISAAFQSKKKEIMVSLAGITILSITLSALIFSAERNGEQHDFKNIWEVFIWSLGKYTGDYGSIAQQVPHTVIGKWLATVNGLLGIALFALPAGLLGSAFIDQMAEEKSKALVDTRIQDICRYFDASQGGKSIFNNEKIKVRHYVFETIQARFVLTDDEIMEAVRESSNLRFRAMKSSPELKFTDIKLIEKFDKNRPYGYFQSKTNRNIWIINPIGASERGISHFGVSLSILAETGYISREVRVYHGSTELGGNSGMAYDAGREKEDFGPDFSAFREDIMQIGPDDLVMILSSGASGHKDLVLEYGNPKKGSEELGPTSTLSNPALLQNIKTNLTAAVEKVEIVAGTAKRHEFGFSIDNHAIGNDNPKWIGPYIRRLTGAEVFTLYINISILINEEERYYALLKGLATFMNSLDGNNKA